MSDVSRLLDGVGAGDSRAAEQLLPLVYDELRRLAAEKMAHEAPGQTLQPTALVHEAYLRLVRGAEGAVPPRFTGRRHFFAVAAEAMRRILIDNARRKGSRKRGAGAGRADLDLAGLAAPARREELIAVESAVDGLAEVNPQAAEVVKLRYFVGLSIAEVAQVLDVSPRTADRVWAYARAWLHQALGE